MSYRLVIVVVNISEQTTVVYASTFKVCYKYGNTYFVIVLDKRQSNLKIYWMC